MNKLPENEIMRLNRLRKVGDSKEVRYLQDEVKLAINLERLAAQKVLLALKIKEKAEIKEHREIDFKEALQYILLSALYDKVDLDGLFITEASYDKEMRLLELVVKSAPDENGNYKEFTYKIKQSDNPVVTTNIDVSDWKGDNPDYPESGEIKAKYINQEWILK